MRRSASISGRKPSTSGGKSSRTITGINVTGDTVIKVSASTI